MPVTISNRHWIAIVGHATLISLVATAMMLSAYCSGMSVWLGLFPEHVTDLPIADQWVIAFDYFRLLDGSYSFLDLFNVHNEHRIFTARLVMFADAYLFSMRGIFPVLVSYIALAAMGAMIVHLALGTERNRVTLAVGFVMSLGIAWAISQHANLTWAMQVCFPLLHLFVLLFYVFLAKALDSEKPYGWLIAGVAADFLATFSLGTGVLTAIPAFAMAIWLRRVDWRILSILSAHAVFAAFYFHNFQFKGVEHYGTATLFDYANLLARFVTTAIEQQHQLLFGYAMLAALTTFLIYVTWQSTNRYPEDANLAVLSAFALFIVAEAGAAAFARSRGLSAAYATPSALFILTLLGIVWRISPNPGSRVAAVALVCLATIGTNTHLFEQIWLNRIQQVASARDSLIKGERKPEYIAIIFPSAPPPFVESLLAKTRELRLGPYR
jgi:hypothetical protein